MTPLQNVLLDPAEVSVAGRVEIPLDGSKGATVYYEGIDWGTQEVKQFMAEGLFGSRPIDSEWPLRVIKLPLVIRPTDTQTFDDVRVMLEQWVAMANLEGGWIKRVLRSGRYVFADIVEAKLHLSASWHAENRDFDNESFLELQALPDLYGPVVTGEAHEFTGDGAFTMQVAGEIPARVQEMKVEDLSGNDQLGLMWHFRRRNYSADPTAEWAYDAETLGLLDIAEKVTLAGSYGTKVVKHPNLSTDWTPVLSTGFLTHTGLSTVWARVYSTSADLPWLRLAYGVGDIVAPQENTQVQVPGKEGFYLVNLGQVNIRALPFGAQRWEGVIQARGEAGGENISLDRIWFQCADECSGVLAALQSTTALASIDASDSLVTKSSEGKAEALNGTEATRGGKWEDATSGTGFEREAEGTTRKTTGDSEGRSALLSGSTIGPVRVKCEIARTASPSAFFQGFYLRYCSSTYWVRVNAQGWYLNLEYCSGGTPIVTIFKVPETVSALLDAELNAAGGVTVRFLGNTYQMTVPATFKKGETHAEGKVGIIDGCGSSSVITRTYKNFIATPLPSSDAVVYAGRSAYLSMNGMYRESEDGLGMGSIGSPGSDLPRLPVSGADERPVEIAAKPSRGQFGELVDGGKDSFKVQAAYRPCYASIPES